MKITIETTGTTFNVDVELNHEGQQLVFKETYQNLKEVLLRVATLYGPPMKVKKIKNTTDSGLFSRKVIRPHKFPVGKAIRKCLEESRAWTLKADLIRMMKKCGAPEYTEQVWAMLLHRMAIEGHIERETRQDGEYYILGKGIRR